MASSPMARRPAAVSVMVLLMASSVVGMASAASSGGRKLQATCHMDSCGVWCGPPRPPPCGEAASSPPGKCQGPYGLTDHLQWGFNPSGQICKCFDGVFKECKPSSPPPSKASCVAGNGKELPNGALGQNAKWQNCKCVDGEWKQCKWSKQAKTCWLDGIEFADGAWASKDSTECKCDDGEWTKCKTLPPSKQPPQQQPPQQEQGCFGELPFGLENCVCDGASVGEMAGLAACGRVSNECLPAIAGFSFTDGTIEAVQQICDTFALDSCMSAAQVAPVVNEACGDLLRLGTAMCSPEKAMSIFMGTVNQACDPLCKDCVRA